MGIATDIASDVEEQTDNSLAEHQREDEQTSYSTTFAEFRQAEADAGLADEGYAGATNTDDLDDDAVIDNAAEKADAETTGDPTDPTSQSGSSIYGTAILVGILYGAWRYLSG